MPLEGGEEGVELLLLGGVEGGQGEDCQPAQGEQGEGVGQGAQQGAAVQHQGELQGVQGVLDEKEGLEVGGEAVVAVGGLEQHGRDLGGREGQWRDWMGGEVGVYESHQECLHQNSLRKRKSDKAKRYNKLREDNTEGIMFQSTNVKMAMTLL